MPKFYVRCGKVRHVIDRPNYARAAYDTVMGHVMNDMGGLKTVWEVSHLGFITVVSEKGFRSNVHALFYPTHHILTCEGSFRHFKKQGGDSAQGEPHDK